MRRRLLVASLLCLLGMGCSFLLSTAEPTQCSTDADCAASPTLRNRVCQGGFCVIPGIDAPGPVIADGSDPCVSTELCTQANSGQLSVCRTKGGRCQVWQTEQCRKVSNIAAAKDPNTIIIGSILPFTIRQFDGTKPASDYADRVRRAIDLAASEFEAAVPGGVLFPGNTRRPIAVLHCDSGLSADGAMLAMKHLTEVVGSPALIVGADEDITTIAAELTAKKTAIACEGCIGALPQGPLAWRIVPRLELEAPMANWRVSQLESELLALPSPPAKIKIALLMHEERSTRDYITRLKSILRFNGGKTISENGADFKVVVAEDTRQTLVAHEKHILELLAFEPDIVLVAMGGDFSQFYLRSVEARWTGARRPHYITTGLNYTLESFGTAVGSNESLRKRISGTRPGFAPELQANVDAFDGRYRPPNNYKDPDGSHSGYDAFYVLGMGILGASSQPLVDGVHISAGIERLRSGTVVDFRPENIPFANLTLSTIGSIDVRGLWSDLDWSITTHDFDASVSMYCLKRDETGSIIIEPNAGVHLTTATGVVDGAYSCD
ncbi:MAG: hypothetical protein KF819_15870 [Labilithrix sp.]|nr:hypothetical protein [Labilithrix sp.]